LLNLTEKQDQHYRTVDETLETIRRVWWEYRDKFLSMPNPQRALMICRCLYLLGVDLRTPKQLISYVLGGPHDSGVNTEHYHYLMWGYSDWLEENRRG